MSANFHYPSDYLDKILAAHYDRTGNIINPVRAKGINCIVKAAVCLDDIYHAAYLNDITIDERNAILAVVSGG